MRLLVLATLVPLVLAGCASPNATPNAANAAAGASTDPASADAAANASAPFVAEGTYHFVFGTNPGLTLWNGDLPEGKAAAGDAISARAEWSAATPASATLVLRIYSGDTIEQEIDGTSPIEVSWIAEKPRLVGLGMRLAAPGAAAQQDVALTLTIAPSLNATAG